MDSSGTTFYLTDALGSILTSFTNASGSAQVKGEQDYAPYGPARYTQGTINTPKGYTGQYTDSLTGLDYYGARYYDPVVGVFLSADKVEGNPQGMNPYGYVGGNPETASDPTGESGGVPNLPQHTTPGSSQPTNIDWGTVLGIALIIPELVVDGLELFADDPNVTFSPDVIGEDPFIEDAAAVADKPVESTEPVNTTSGVLPSGTLASGTAGEVTSTLDTEVEAIKVADEQKLLTDSQTGTPPEPKGTPCSFTASTEVATSRGEQPIGKLQVGEKVMAYNPKTHQMEQEPILHVWVHTDNDLVNLTLTSTSPAKHGKPATKSSEVIHTNQKHPFLTEEKGFLPVSRITLGMHLLRADGTYGVVTGWKSVPGSSVMYNLEVAQDHTFTVGNGQWVVHNCGSSPLAQQADVEAKGLVNDGISSGIGRSRTTVSVAYVQDFEGTVTRLVSMNSNSMSRWGSAVQELLNPDDVWVSSQGPGLHAEQNLLRFATSNNLDILGLGVSRNICGICWSELSQSVSTDVIGTGNTAGWMPPWM